jgi:hypothetical protein
MSSILSRPRHRLTAVLPSKRRILVLTDTPRLLCVKEERDRVVVKSALLFSGAGANANVKAAPPQVVPNARGRSIARWKQSSTSTSGSASGVILNSGASAGSNVGNETEANAEHEPVTSETIQSVETKGEKSFVVQTVSVHQATFAPGVESSTCV